MTESERQQHGVSARIAQNDAVLQMAFDGVEADIHEAWATSWTQRGRERAHYELKALKRLRVRLAQMASHAPR